MSDQNLQSPPTPHDVVTRMIILKYVAVASLAVPPRHMLAEVMRHWSDQERDDFKKSTEDERDEFWKGLKDAGLWPHLTASERIIADSTAYTMTHRQQVDASWQTEGAQVLLWALEIVPEFPPYDTMADQDILRHIGFVSEPQLRDPALLMRTRDVAELWMWRSRTRLLVEKGEPFELDEAANPFGFKSYDDIVKYTATKAAEEGDIPATVNSDFPVNGRAFRDISADEWSEVQSIITERLHALNWLCGYAPGNDWDKTPLSS